MVGFGKIMEMGQKLQKRVGELQEELENIEVSGSSRGGLVTAIVDGKGSIRQVRIGKALANGKDEEILEKLIVAAVGDAQQKASKISKKKMKKITGRLPIPLPGLGL
jgi:DNA-binding YbaB/EbfC family protein|tara:strand:- start:2777 stop:3097 length:321 start_codon:yes stop_codon:yes gene_type:complete